MSSLGEGAAGFRFGRMPLDKSAALEPVDQKTGSTIRTGKLVVNLDTRVVSVDDLPVRLTGMEYGILQLLSLRKGTTITKEMFLNHLYGGGMHEPELKIIDVLSANCARNSPKLRAAAITSKRFGAAAMSFAMRPSYHQMSRNDDPNAPGAAPPYSPGLG